VIGSNSIRETWKTLGDRAKLKLPPLEVGWLSWPAALWSQVAEVLVFVACGAAVTFALHRLTGMNVGWAILSNILVLPLLAMAILTPLQFFFGAIPRRIETVGDFAREAAGHSFTELWQDKRGYGPADLWSALTAMLRRHTGHQGVIDRETTFVARDARTT
jgi:hypothetical protein